MADIEIVVNSSSSAFCTGGLLRIDKNVGCSKFPLNTLG